MRRSRRKGQLRRTSSMRRRSHSTISVSSLSVEASAITCPKGSATKEEPQNSMPLSGGPSKPTRLTAATKMPLAMACERWMVRQASSCAAPNSLFSRGMPADGRGIEQNVRAAQAGEARAFRIPLVPADQHADAAVARVEIGKAQIAGREIKLFVVERIVGDVHLAIDAQQRAVGVEDRGGVVVQAGGAALEERSDDHDAELARPACPALRWKGRESVRPDRSSRDFPRGKNIASGKAPRRQTICAPRLAASRIAGERGGEIFRGIERAAGAGPGRHLICRAICRAVSRHDVNTTIARRSVARNVRATGCALQRRKQSCEDAANAAQHGVEHCRREAAGLRVLLAGMIGGEEARQIVPGSLNSAPWAKR